MSLIVQKYGGSSLADTAKIKRVARRVAKVREQGEQVVVVVSAMGKTTDHLIEMAHRVSDQPDARELDRLLSTGEAISSTLLAMSLKKLGCPAISLSGAQAGIHTDSSYSRARILNIETGRIFREMSKGKVVIVAGFQGITRDMNIATLGRGGSDTTAVALAIGLKADMCQIYTDVEGIYTADPRLVPEAVKMEEVDYDEMLELASSGAKVMHARAVELGGIYGMPILVASSFSDRAGTIICRGASFMENINKVRGIAHDTNVAKITVVRVPDQPGVAAAIFVPLAEAGISVDTIVQNASIENCTDLTFTVTRDDLPRAIEVTEKVTQRIGAERCVSAVGLAKISVVGTGMQSTPGYAAKMFRSMKDAEINIQMITTSEIKITCIISEGRVEDAVRVLHKEFGLARGE